MRDPNWLPTMYDIARAANEARTGPDALARALEILVDRLGLDGGAVQSGDSQEIYSTGTRSSGLVASIPIQAEGRILIRIQLFGRAKPDPSLLSEVSSLLSPVLERDLRSDAAARTLHDGLGQELTGLGFLAGCLAEELSRFPGAAKKAERFAAGLRRASERVRSISRGLMPVDVRSLGLKAALTEFASGIREFYGIQCRLECRGLAAERARPAAEQLYFIAQEAATNAARHSGATLIRIRLEGVGREIRLTVDDNGRGILAAEPADGSGLRIMRRRAAAIGASLAIQRRPGGGTRMKACVPVSSRPGGDRWPSPGRPASGYSSSTITR